MNSSALHCLVLWVLFVLFVFGIEEEKEEVTLWEERTRSWSNEKRLELPSSRRRLKTKKYKKKSASKSSGMPTTDTDTINKEYWESAVCSKKSVIGGDGWCIGKDAWQRVLDFKAKLRPTLDYEMFQDDCCKYLQEGLQFLLTCAHASSYESYHRDENTRNRNSRKRMISCGLTPFEETEMSIESALHEGRYTSYWSFAPAQ
jgi:hypothetical protein